MKSILILFMIGFGIWSAAALYERGEIPLAEIIPEFTAAGVPPIEKTPASAPPLLEDPEPVEGQTPPPPTPPYQGGDQVEVEELVNADFSLLVKASVLVKTNAARLENGLLALASDDKLAQVALAHSQDMAEKNYFNHVNEEGCSAACRLNQAEYKYRSMGENIFWMQGYKLTAEATAEKIVDGWMDSPGHRANILEDSFTHTDVGIYVLGDRVYATAPYALPR